MTRAMQLPIPATTCHATGEHANIGARQRGALWSSFEDLCELLGVAHEGTDALSGLLFQHRSLKAGQRLVSAGDPFEALWVVHGGFLKRQVVDTDGNEHVLAFPMRGDVVGADGFADDRHTAEVVALCDCSLVVIPAETLLAIGKTCGPIERFIYRLVSRQLVAEQLEHAALTAIGSDARVARFLLAQSQRYAALGFSPRSFLLRMTRREIGSYLGLTLETVCRALSSLHMAGVIAVDQRNIELTDRETLAALARGNHDSGAGPTRPAQRARTPRPRRPEPTVSAAA